MGYDEDGWLLPGFAPPQPPPGTPPPPSPPPSPPSPVGLATPPGSGISSGAITKGGSIGSPAQVNNPTTMLSLALREQPNEVAKVPVPAQKDLNGLTGAALARMGLIPSSSGPVGSTNHGWNNRGL